MLKKHNPKLTVLLNALADGQFHDGNDLGALLGVSRSAIWKMCQKLQALGVNLHSEKVKGYCLREPMQLLNLQQIQSMLKKTVDCDLFASVESTNDYLMAMKPAVRPRVCLAEMQTAGRGRLGRLWVSPFGQNIYLSLRFRFAKDISELSGLSLVVSLSILKMLKQAGIKEPVHVKWPNDVITAAGKLSGTLIELKAESHGGCEAIIGIGINVNMPVKKMKTITQPWTSLLGLTGQAFDRNVLVGLLINQLLQDLSYFQTQGFAPFLEDWVSHDYFYGKTVSLQYGDAIITGVASGINGSGHLMLTLDDGSTRAFASGDARLIKPD